MKKNITNAKLFDEKIKKDEYDNIIKVYACLLNCSF